MKKVPVKTKTVRQTITFREVTPREVYDTYLDSKKHAAFTQAKASMSKAAHGKFRAWNGWISGENLELVSGKRIVQKWRGRSWPKGHYSQVTFNLKKIPGGTLLRFTHSGVPVGDYESIKKGWFSSYWDRMKAYFLRDTGAAKKK